MGQLANDIHSATQAIPVAPVTDPADLLDGPGLLAIFAKVEAAVAVLELVTRGARIIRTAGVPNNTTDGENGDLAINLATADLYAKDAGTWSALFNLKGPAGKDATGQAGASAYQVAVQQGFAGTADQWLASLGRKGDEGKSAYQVAVAAGFVGSVGAWLDSLKVQGDAGQRGNIIRWESYAPTNEDGLVGDMWVHSTSATKCAFHKCTASANGVGTWSLRYTSPDAAASTGGAGGTGTVKSVSVNGGTPVAPDTNGNVALTVQAGSPVTPVQELGAGSATDIPSTAAVVKETGKLNDLGTTDKTSLVAAINEVRSTAATLAGNSGQFSIAFTQFSDVQPIAFSAPVTITNVKTLRDIGTLKGQLFYNGGSVAPRITADVAPSSLTTWVQGINADITTAKNNGYGGAYTLEMSAVITTGRSRGEVLLAFTAN